MRLAPDASAREKILFLLKTKGPQTAGQLAKRLRVTAMAVRQHLYQLSEAKLVGYRDERRKVGRPARVWNLTAQAQGRFPDSHGELAEGLLEAVSEAFGEEGMAKLVQLRTRAQQQEYRMQLPSPDAALEKRVAALASLRREEGYMAEWQRNADGSLALIENHCPICAAATLCRGLCEGELDLFKRVLGPGVKVERTEYILEGARRCAYRIVGPSP